VFFGLPIPIPPNVDDPDIFRETMVVMRIIMALFYGILIALSSFWLWFLNTRATREQFGGVAKADPSQMYTPRRPVSISIIGWYLLISAFLLSLISFLHFPAFLLGFLLKGWSATLIMLLMCVLQVVIGIGLLKLKAWARISSICYFTFFEFNSFAMLLIPGSEARFEEAQTEIQKALAIPPIALNNIPNSLHRSMWFGLAIGLPLFAILLWFLITNKRAFEPASQPPD